MHCLRITSLFQICAFYVVCCFSVDIQRLLFVPNILKCFCLIRKYSSLKKKKRNSFIIIHLQYETCNLGVDS